jgi:UDP-N-acetylglucosamine 2-epimerase
MKIVTIVGARPQFIKAAAVSRAIQAFNRSSARPGSRKRLREVLVHTGQHYDYLMDRIFFEELRLPEPHYHLATGSGSHAVQTGRMLKGVEKVLEKEKPEITVVYGDTNSTIAGALAAAKLNIPVAHVEAGLRSYKRSMPEEINRLLTDHISKVLFCPTVQAVRNLSEEGIRNGDKTVVKNVGDVMYDSILYYSELAEKKSTVLAELGLFHPNTRHSTPGPMHYYLATLHRAENTDNPKRLKSIIRALAEIAKDIPVILPLHPRTKKMMKVQGLIREARGIRLIDPVSYLDMLRLEKHARIILTDSGGVQKEAYWFWVPCITLREETEWLETIRSGWNVLVGTESDRIVNETKHQDKRTLPSSKTKIFGDGKASEKIVQTLFDYFLR